MFAASYVKSNTSAFLNLSPSKTIATPRPAVRSKSILQFLTGCLQLPLLPLLILYPTTTAAQAEDASPAFRKTGDVLKAELVPSFNGSFKGEPFRTNRWGMRDNDYSLKPPPRTYRIALLGSSFSMGGGVPVEQTHEWLLEERLNREGPGAPRQHYEILNFSVGGYGILQYLVLADSKVFRFAPNAVIMVIHSIEVNRIADKLVGLIQAKVPIPYPYIEQKLLEAGVQPGMEEPELRRRLRPVIPDIIQWIDRRIVEICRAHGVPLVGILFPEPRPRGEEARSKMSDWASEAGIPVLRLAGAFRGHPLDSVRLKGDVHLNALGHKLVADRLYEALRTDDARGLKLGFSQAK